MLDTQTGPYWTMLGLEMAQTWPSGAPPVQDIDFRTNIGKATLIIIKKWMLEAQSIHHLRPCMGPEMAINGPNMAIWTIPSPID